MRPVPRHLFPGAHRGKGTGGGYPQDMHGLADDVLAQNRTKGRATISPAGVGCPTCSLQLDVVAMPSAVNHFAQQDGAPIAQLRVVAAELVSGIHAGQRFGALGHGVTRHHLDALG